MTMLSATFSANDINALYELPLMALLHQAHLIHRETCDPNEIECCALFNIKTGRCPEDCAYCPQSAHYNTGLPFEKICSVDTVVNEAKRAKNNGATRFCMGAAWKNPPKKDWPLVLEMIKAVKAEGLETCMTLGMLDKDQAQILHDTGLDYYNHNLDTSPGYYEKIITTRTYQDRLNTLQHVHSAGLNVCCGGILGLGESREDRVQFLLSLTKLTAPPKSIPLNQLIAIKGTPLADATCIDSFEFIRTVAITRIMFPESKIRLSAGRENMSDEMQTLCFFAGANSLFLGEKLLTAKNPDLSQDKRLFNRLGIKTKTSA